MLELKNFSLYIKDTNLIDDINLQINQGEIHVLMGKNGVGKSSIAKSLIGDDSYKVKGNIIFNGEDITNLETYKRAQKGLYLINQMPPQIEGVTNAELLRVALNEKEGKPVNIFEFNKELESICKSLELDKSFIHKDINVGASGGERKKIELLHMNMLKPSFIILDEIDSGLDVDALKMVAKNILSYYEKYNPSILIITHNDNLLKYFDNYKVSVISDKKIIKTGDKSLVKEVLSEGFKELNKTNIISEN